LESLRQQHHARLTDGTASRVTSRRACKWEVRIASGPRKRMVRPFDARNGLSSEILQPEMDPRCQLVDTVHWVCRFLGQSCSLLTYHFNRDIAEGVRGTGSERAKVPEALSRLMGDETSNAIRNVFPSLCVCVCVCVCVCTRVTSC